MYNEAPAATPPEHQAILSFQKGWCKLSEQCAIFLLLNT